jgi:hypothetical protein
MDGGKDKPTNLPVYMAPDGVAQPRIVARLLDAYVIGEPETVEGTYTVVAQVERLLLGEDAVSAIRVIRNVLPTQRAVETITQALRASFPPLLNSGLT